MPGPLTHACTRPLTSRAKASPRYSVPAKFGRITVGYDAATFAGYWYAQFLHDDGRADAVSDRGQFPTVFDLIAGTWSFVDWPLVPYDVIRSLVDEGDRNDRQAAYILAAALAGRP